MRDAVALFFAVHTQWRWTGAGMGGLVRTGLDYSVLKPTAEGIGLTMTPALFNDIRTLEQASIDTWNGKG